RKYPPTIRYSCPVASSQAIVVNEPIQKTEFTANTDWTSPTYWRHCPLVKNPGTGAAAPASTGQGAIGSRAATRTSVQPYRSQERDAVAAASTENASRTARTGISGRPNRG